MTARHRTTRVARATRVTPAGGAGAVARPLALALGAVFLLFWLGIGTRDLPGDLILYFDYANHVADGHIPYRDFQLEYPLLALAPILLAFGLSLGGSFAGFEAAFALLMYGCALVGGLLVWRLLGRLLPEARAEERGWRLAAYVVAWPLLGQLVTTRYDALPMLLTVAALALWLERREGWAWLALAAGVAVKLTPAVIAPIFAIDLLIRRGPRAALAGGLRFALASALLLAPGLLVGGRDFGDAFRYHGERGIQIESGYANGLLLLNRLTGFAVGTDHVFGGFEAISGWTDELKVVSTLVQLALLGAVAVAFAWLRTRPGATPLAAERQLALAATLAVGVFILGGKVFSPQYLIWLMPLVVLAPGRAGWRAIGCFLTACLVTQLLFPYAYDTLLDRDWLGIALLTLRNLLFAAMLGWLAAAWVRDEARQ